MRVRAAANFAGARAGRTYIVDGRSAEVQSKIAKGWFVPLDEPETTPAKRKPKR